MPTPDMQHVAHRQEARIEDQEFARSLTLKEKNDFQKLLMKAYAATVEVSSIPLVEGDATLSQDDRIFSHWIRRYGKQYSDLVLSDVEVRRKIREMLARPNNESVQFRS